MGAGPTVRAAPVVAAALLALAPGASAQWVIESTDGRSSIKLGLLAQPEAEWLEAPARPCLREVELLLRDRFYQTRYLPLASMNPIM